MATFGWSYKSNVSGAKTPKELPRKLEPWQKERPAPNVPLHRQSHSTESVYAGMKRRRYNPRAKVFVGNLNKDTKAVTLAEYFSVFGEITSLKIIKDRETGISRGFAFITFTETEAAEKAIRWCKHHYPKLDGKQITISGAERRQRNTVDRRTASLKDRRRGQTLYWEYKWKDEPDAEVFGPYETSLMLAWSDAGYFSAGCWVKQTDPNVYKHTEYIDNHSEDPEIHEPELKRPKLVESYTSSSSSEDEETPTENQENTGEIGKYCNSSTRENISNMTPGNESISMSIGLHDGTHDTKGEDTKCNTADIELKHTAGSGELVHGDVYLRNRDSPLATTGDSSAEHYTCSGGSEITDFPACESETAETSEGWSSGGSELLDNNTNNHVATKQDSDISTQTDDDDCGPESADNWSRACVHDLVYGRSRDSSSDEDEAYYYLEDNAPVTENQFVHVSEIDFSMFP